MVISVTYMLLYYTHLLFYRHSWAGFQVNVRVAGFYIKEEAIKLLLFYKPNFATNINENMI